jgi:hypothetical protein
MVIAVGWRHETGPNIDVKKQWLSYFSLKSIACRGACNHCYVKLPTGINDITYRTHA